MMQTIKVSDVIWRQDLYPRTKPDAAKIQVYSENVEMLPPIEVNQHNILIDGYHRWRAYQTAKIEDIPAIITETGSEEELLKLAITRNATHGLQLSDDEKRTYALRWWDVLPDEEICAVLSISASTFARWTKSKREQKEEQIKREIIERWMRCESQAAIAEAVGVSREKVNDIIANFGKNEQVNDFTIFRNFTPQTSTERGGSLRFDNFHEVNTISGVTDKPNTQPTGYTAATLAVEAGVTKQYVAWLCRNGKLACERWGHLWFIRYEVGQAWLAERNAKQAQP